MLINIKDKVQLRVVGVALVLQMFGHHPSCLRIVQSQDSESVDKVPTNLIDIEISQGIYETLGLLEVNHWSL